MCVIGACACPALCALIVACAVATYLVGAWCPGPRVRALARRGLGLHETVFPPWQVGPVCCIVWLHQCRSVRLPGAQPGQGTLPAVRAVWLAPIIEPVVCRANDSDMPLMMILVMY